MEFGRVPASELDNIDFSLPTEPEWNKQILKGKPFSNARVYLGCAKWGRPEWVGKIYPLKTKEKDFLQHYVHHYNSIELNATHYRIWGEAGIKKWAEKAKGLDFKFCPKRYQGVTHRGRLTEKDFLVNEFFRGIVAFGEHLGPVFVQVSDSYSPNRKKELFDFLASLPKDIQFFLEVRHPGWFAKAEVFNEMLQRLEEMKIGIVITDTAGRRDCAHMHLTLPKTFIRYVGNSLHSSDYTRCDAWVQRMKYWLDKGMEELYFIVHSGNDEKSPEITIYLAEKIKNEVDENILVPKLITGNISDQ